MKIETKMRIVEWVCRRINMPSPYKHPPFNIERGEVRIVDVFAQQSYPDPELLHAPITDDEIKKELCLMLGNQLSRTSLVRFTKDPNPFDPIKTVCCRAKISIVPPLNHY